MNGGHFEFRTSGRTRSILKDQDKTRAVGSGTGQRGHTLMMMMMIMMMMNIRHFKCHAHIIIRHTLFNVTTLTDKTNRRPVFHAVFTTFQNSCTRYLANREL
jgi:hypothetical protein